MNERRTKTKVGRRIKDSKIVKANTCAHPCWIGLDLLPAGKVTTPSKSSLRNCSQVSLFDPGWMCWWN